MSEPKFSRGNLVRHRASGELAVVMGAICYSRSGDHSRYLHALRDGETDDYKFAGAYDLDLGFKQDVVAVEEYLLEPAWPEPEGGGGA